MTIVDLAYDILGEGRLVVLIHGITEDRHSWDSVPLSEHYRVLRVDLRGHGESPGGESYDPQTLARDVHAVVARAADGETPLVVGHSMGGVVATAYAGLFPVHAVINIDQPLALVEMQDQVKQAGPLLRGNEFDDFITGMFAQMCGALDPAEVTRLTALRKPNQHAVLGMWSPLLGLSPEELDSLVKRIATLPPGTPYLSLHGLDPGPEYGPWLGALIPGATVEIWAETPTHYPHLADPARFIRRVHEMAV